MKRITINWNNYSAFSSTSFDFRLIDSAEIIPGKEGWGEKKVSSLDWYFRMHFPSNPMMPGVLIMESMRQTAHFVIACLPNSHNKTTFFSNCKTMHLYNSVRPGDVLKTHVILKHYEQGIACFSGNAAVKRFGEEKELLVSSMVFEIAFDYSSRSLSNISENTSFNDFATKELNKRLFNFSNMGNYFAQTQEYRFVDSAEVSLVYAVGKKCCSSLDWYFGFEKTIMPLGFVMETLLQTGALIITQREEITNPLMMFNDCSELEFFSDVRPGDEISTYVKMNSFRSGIARFVGEAMVGNRVVCKMKFTLIHPDEIKRFSDCLRKRSNTQ